MSTNRIIGVTKGVVVDIDDPAGLGRVRVRIPQIHGCFDEEVYANCDEDTKRVSRIKNSCLPWAEVCYPYGSDVQPEPNQVVLVSFINGDGDKPIILGWLGYEYTNSESIFVKE